MKISLLSAVALLALTAPATAQNTNTSTSGSDSTSGAASQSGASSDNHNANTQGQNANNYGQGNSTSTSGSASNSTANTASSAASYGNQQSQMQGQQATNQQGTTVTNTFNTVNRKHTEQEFRTNAPVPLAASSSFSSDYCGGTASGGASASPIGISIGGAAPVFDKSCQSLRRAEKFGMAAANAMNMQQPELAGKLMSMMIWSICTSDSQGPKATASTADACAKAALLGSEAAPGSPPATAQPAVTAQQSEKARQDAQVATTATAVATAQTTALDHRLRTADATALAAAGPR